MGFHKQLLSGYGTWINFFCQSQRTLRWIFCGFSCEWMCVLESLPSGKLRNRHGKSIIFIFRCYVRNYRGLSQKKPQTKPPFWCFQKNHVTFEHPKKKSTTRTSTGRSIIFPASNSSLEKRRQHPVKCNRRAALPPDTKCFFGGHFFIRWRK